MNTKGKGSKKEEAKKEVEVLDLKSWNIDRVRVVTTKEGKDLVFLTLMLNGISINNCRIVTGKNGDFISFPQYKGTNGEYYNVVYAKLSEEDTKNICALVQEKIDEM